MNQYTFNEKEHLHLLNDKPLTGTSSVVGVLSKPLSWWASGMAVSYLGWTHAKPKVNGKYVQTPIEERIKTATEKFEQIKNGSCEDYIKLLDAAYANHSKQLDKSAKKGTDLHAECEDFVKGEMGIRPKRKYDEKIQPFIEWSAKNVKKFLASEAHTYSERMWVGGIIDAVAELNDGTLVIIDFKSSKEAYTSQFIQCAGYAIQIEESGLLSKDGKKNKKIDGKIGALIVVPFGASVVVPEVKKEVEEHKKGFEAALVLYRLLGMDK